VNLTLSMACNSAAVFYRWLTRPGPEYLVRSQVLEILARPERFELPTSWFVERLSNEPNRLI